MGALPHVTLLESSQRTHGAIITSLCVKRTSIRRFDVKITLFLHLVSTGLATHFTLGHFSYRYPIFEWVPLPSLKQRNQQKSSSNGNQSICLIFLWNAWRQFIEHIQYNWFLEYTCKYSVLKCHLYLFTSTIPDNHHHCQNRDCNTDFRFGMHENYEYYMNCRRRGRNKGLFLGSQVITEGSHECLGDFIHQALECLFNRLCRLTSRKGSTLCITGPLWWGINFTKGQ